MVQKNLFANQIKQLQHSTDIMMRGYTVRSKIPIIGPLIAWIPRNCSPALHSRTESLFS